MNRSPCIFGEVLFDHFSDGSRVLGGAPFNVAWHLQAFGLAPLFISRIGRDAEGEQVRCAMTDWGMDTRGLQVDDALATGRVSVELIDHEPRYDIVAPVAYDRITGNSSVLDDRGLVYHGSLALREAISRQTLDTALAAATPSIVFVDVNLRPPWWSRELVSVMIARADWVKLNTDELRALGSAAEIDDPAAFVADHDLQGLVLTHGADGAEVHTADGRYARIRPAGGSAIVDTVGAGDAFASVMIAGLCLEWPLQIMLQRAQDFASAIVGQRGATVSDRGFYRPFIGDWKLGH